MRRSAAALLLVTPMVSVAQPVQQVREIVGAGSIVTRDVAAGATVYGSPARKR